MKVNLFAIDEAHCISQWGHDFRPAYRNVSILKELHLETPVVALTATATKKVADDICNQLELRNPFIQKESFIRANIIQRVERIENKAVVLEQALHQHPGSVIIYTRSRKRTESISKKINDWGFKASYYHAGLDIKSRKQIEKSWKENKTPIVVATNAFGMGIDKADVRLVVHMDIPGSMEEYYQESGRAGRDGKPSTALIIYNKEDVLFQTKMFSFKFPERKAIKAIYNSLGNYFQIGSGGGQGMAFVFDLNKFCKTFNYEPLSVHYALQILQNEGYIFVSEEVTKSSKLKIIQGRNQIETIIEQDSFQSKVLSVLLRSHTSLFQDYIKISESDLAAKLESDEQKIGNSLQLLEKLKVVDYKRKNFHPRIIYSNERLPSSSLSISKEILEERKESAQRQLDYMVSFVEETEKCRTNIALYYFNERPEKRCGKCDTCEKKSGTKSINSFLLEFISEPKLLQDIINQSPYAKTETIEAIRLLLEDKKLGRTENKITPFTS